MKKTLCLMLTFLMLLPIFKAVNLLPVFAEATSGRCCDNLTWEFDQDTPDTAKITCTDYVIASPTESSINNTSLTEIPQISEAPQVSTPGINISEISLPETSFITVVSEDVSETVSIEASVDENVFGPVLSETSVVSTNESYEQFLEESRALENGGNTIKYIALVAFAVITVICVTVSVIKNKKQ